VGVLTASSERIDTRSIIYGLGTSGRFIEPALLQCSLCCDIGSRINYRCTVDQHFFVMPPQRHPCIQALCICHGHHGLTGHHASSLAKSSFIRTAPSTNLPPGAKHRKAACAPPASMPPLETDTLHKTFDARVMEYKSRARSTPNSRRFPWGPWGICWGFRERW